MSRSKYSPEAVEIIIDAIRKEGTHTKAWIAAKISRYTFYEWIKKYPEFATKVAQAEKFFDDNQPQNQILLAKRSLIDYLEGRAIETWTSEETTEVYNAAGELTNTVKKRAVKRVKRPPPPWVIDRVLGKSLNIEELFLALVVEGILPADKLEEFRKVIIEIQKTALKTLSPNAPILPESQDN